MRNGQFHPGGDVKDCSRPPATASWTEPAIRRLRLSITVRAGAHVPQGGLQDERVRHCLPAWSATHRPDLSWRETGSSDRIGSDDDNGIEEPVLRRCCSRSRPLRPGMRTSVIRQSKLPGAYSATKASARSKVRHDRSSTRRRSERASRTASSSSTIATKGALDKRMTFASTAGWPSPSSAPLLAGS